MKSCVCLLSGGQDSTTTLFWAKNQFENVFALIIDYGQKHSIEIESAKTIAKIANVPYKVLLLKDYFYQLTESALINDGNVNSNHKLNPSLPASFVPGRNIIFITSACILANQLGYKNVVTGVCQTDYSGYPDCRLETVESVEKSFFLGTEYSVKVHTPLMFLTKAETVKLAIELEGCLEALKFSHTCYNGVYPPCGICPSCVLRAKGFKEAGISDPLFI